MPRKYLIVIAVSLSCMFGCVSVESVTKPGATGVDGKTMLLIDADQLNAEAGAAYDEMMHDAASAARLNKDAAKTKQLRRIGDRLVRHVAVFRDDAPHWNWEINLIESSDLNAFCMPGGKIAFYTGIIDKLDLSDDEIAAIMGHEIAHALREHSNARISRAMWANVLTLGAGAVIDLDQVSLGDLNSAKQLLLELPHSRKHETEADIMGIELAARAGFDPAAAVRVWEKMSAQGGASIPEFQSTHPSHHTRISNIRSKLPLVEPLYAGGTGAPAPKIDPDKNQQAASLRMQAIEQERESFRNARNSIEALLNK